MSEPDATEAVLEHGPWLRGTLALCGTAAWLVAGGARIAEGADPPFFVAWLAYGAALGGALATHALARARALTLLQVALALALLFLGMPHFEGALLAVAFAQLRRTLSIRTALVTVTACVVPHFAVVLPTHGVLGACKASGELLAFGVFAVALYELLWREHASRRAQEAISAELVATRRLLADTVRAGEQRRIGRDLHDALGFQLEVLRDRLESGAPTQDALRALDDLAMQVRAALAGEATLDLGLELERLAAGLPSVTTRLDAPACARLDPARARVVFRAAQESLTNAARHQREAALVWTLEEAEHAIRFTARSVGPRRAGVLSSGTGLDGLRARAEEVGGSLHLRAGDDAFVVEVELPAPARDGAA